jgi:hypothetical protein
MSDLPDKFHVSEDDSAMSEIERPEGEFDVQSFKEQITERTTDFDRKNFPAENWANHCW